MVSVREITGLSMGEYVVFSQRGLEEQIGIVNFLSGDFVGVKAMPDGFFVYNVDDDLMSLRRATEQEIFVAKLKGLRCEDD
jgi:hypothetical protein